jgi:predicted class III extradiol MEMO1 family dioxygenase
MFTLGFLKMKYTTISTLLVIYPICLSNADYDLSFNQSEIIMEQGESTQITILMNSTDLWFGGDISINSITSAPGLILV